MDSTGSGQRMVTACNERFSETFEFPGVRGISGLAEGRSTS